MDGACRLGGCFVSGGAAAAAADRIPLLILLTGALGSISSLRQELQQLTAMAGFQEGTLSVFLKVLGMSYTAELTAQTCSDLGENSLALKVQLLGKLSVFTLTAPLLLELLQLILELAP